MRLVDESRAVAVADEREQRIVDVVLHLDAFLAHASDLGAGEACVLRLELLLVREDRVTEARHAVRDRERTDAEVLAMGERDERGISGEAVKYRRLDGF